MEEMDIVIPLLDKSSNDYQELKYTLRGIDRNLKYRDIYLVGGFPTWAIGLKHIEAKDEFPNKQLNSLFKITAACKNNDISENFILMNDDFYILKPTEIKYLQQGELRARVVEKQKVWKESKYWHSLKRTAELFKNGKDFELHYPIIYNKKKFLGLAKKYNLGEAYLMRSLYCNHYKIEGEYCEDCKAFNLIDLRNFLRAGVTFTSSGDRCYNTLFENVMRFHLPGKSKYEK